MAAEITLFAAIGQGRGHTAQVPQQPINSYTATIASMAQDGIIRVYANAAPVVLTTNGITWTVPSGSVEYFGVSAGQAITVA